MYSSATETHTTRDEAIMLSIGRLPAKDARYVLYRLVVDGKTSLDEVEHLRRRRLQEITALRTIMSQFGDAAVEHERRQPRKKETRPRQLSPEVRERRRIHGRFVGLLRTVEEPELREKFRTIYEAQSPSAAIDAILAHRNKLAHSEQVQKDSGVDE